MEEAGWLHGCRQGAALRNGEAAGCCQVLSLPPCSPAYRDGGGPGRVRSRAGDMGHRCSRAEAPALAQPDM